MGIIKATAGAVGGVLGDQWLEMYECDSIPQGTLIQHEHPRVNPARSSNTHATDGLISDGSIILVNEGQCAFVVESGKVVACFDRPGENVFHSNRSPSIFSGRGLKGLGESVIERIGFGGDVCVRQIVLYLNTKELLNIPFHVTCPIQVSDKGTGFSMDAQAIISGLFSMRIADPKVFFERVCRGVNQTASLSQVSPQLQAEFAQAAAEGIAILTADGVSPSELPGKTTDLCDAIQRAMTQKWIALRGFAVSSVAIGSIRVSERDRQIVRDLGRDKMLRDPVMAAATLVGAQAAATEAAARNTAGAPVTSFGFMAPTPAPAAGSKLWCCSCGKWCSTPFCDQCGAKRPE
ncbi:MAG: SPFH domain-containing protein [Clostridia bacterium]|nr:SPFH domain-containing protein [Clostridia bacterium]